VDVSRQQMRQGIVGLSLEGLAAPRLKAAGVQAGP